jgi:hypothetical protein
MELQVARIVLVSLTLVAAFVAGQHSSSAVAAQSHAKWEYKIIDHGPFHSMPGLTGELNKLGEEGWEAVSMNNVSVLLRRSK